MSTSNDVAVPWKEGVWKMGQIKAYILRTTGKNTMDWKNLISLEYPDIEAGGITVECEYGSFGEAREEVAAATGVKEYNFKAKCVYFQWKGVLADDGTKVTTFGMANNLEDWEWMDDKMIKRTLDDRDPFDAPSCPHITPKPNEQGKIFWLSGPPGAGKSTNCQLLAKHKNFVYYEADCTMSLINPFTDLETENPSMASFNSKALKGMPEESVRTILEVAKLWEKVLDDKSIFEERFKPVYKLMADDIQRQRKRLGGTFAVAHAVATRGNRDFIKSLMGPDLVFIVLNLTQECTTERIMARHGESAEGAEGLERAHSAFQPAEEDEERAYNVTIQKGMSKQEVLQKVLEIVDNI